MSRVAVFQRYTATVDTTIKVDSAVRDRLALLAQERGTTVRALVAELAESLPTLAERQERSASVVNYLRTRVAADLDADDVQAGEDFWRELQAGRLPAALTRRDEGTDNRAA